MNYKKIYLLLAAFFAVTASYAEAEYRDIYPDTWVAIDGADRIMSTASQNPQKTDKERTVGIFYVSWHYDFFHSSFGSPYKSDVTKILQDDPTARFDYFHPNWPHEFACHWGEPEFGYFTSGDPYVIRKDISMLSDAGVDVLILDFTNAVLYHDAWHILLREMSAMKAEGHKVPKVCWWGYNGEVAQCAAEIYDRYYKNNLYPELWFYWDGKPLLLCNKKATYREDLQDFFTMRHMWWGYYEQDGKYYVGSEDLWSFGYDMHDTRVSNLSPAGRASYHNGRAEQMCVTPAQHSSTLVGKSWTVSAGEPNLNEYDLPLKKFINKKWVDNPEYLGLYFRDRWNEALSVDPDFLYINDWNEWIAGQFYEPGAQFMRRTSNFIFVDQYNAEFNRTIQPMKGGGTDNYYMQMVDGIRRYKGAREAPVAKISNKLTINSAISDWDAEDVCFYDTKGDIWHRNFTGYGGNVYVDQSGRNDIVLSKVSVNGDRISFYVETASTLTNYLDENWMLLFINSDCDFTTGWEGFDYVLNREFANPSQSRIMAWDNESKIWQARGVAEFRVYDNKLVMDMPLSSVGLTASDKGNFYFKWADNPEGSLSSAISLCTHGDTAPNRRFCYNYRWDFNAALIDNIDVDAPALRVTKVGEKHIHVDCQSPFTIVNVAGAVVATGNGSATIELASSGIYIVNADNQSNKIMISL